MGTVLLFTNTTRFFCLRWASRSASPWAAFMYMLRSVEPSRLGGVGRQRKMRSVPSITCERSVVKKR